MQTKFNYEDYPHNHTGSVSVRNSANDISKRLKRLDDYVRKKKSICGGIRNGKEKI